MFGYEDEQLNLMHDADYLALRIVMYLTVLFIARSVYFKIEEKFWAAKSNVVTSGHDAPITDEPLLRSKRTIWEVAFPCLNAYTFLYMVCGWLIFDEYRRTYANLSDSNWLDSETLRLKFTVPNPDDPEGPPVHDPELPGWWENELNLILQGGWLRYYTLSTPLFLCMTFAVSIWNYRRHLKELVRQRGGFKGDPGVDSTMMVIALPLIACMMAFMSLSRMWMVCTNWQWGSLGHVADFSGKKSWVARLVVCQNYYATNFMITDIYESWALLHFADIALDVIACEKRRRQTGGEARDVNTLKALTNQGIYLFALTSAIEAMYHLGTTSVEAYFSGSRIVHFEQVVRSRKEQAEYFFLGMGTIASTAAIGAVVTIEVTFEDLLHTFRPGAKFWSTKVLVSLAFVQSLLLYVPPLDNLSVTEKNMIYSATLTVECFFVSILHLIAWVPKEPWYKDLKANTLAHKD